jgi:hypothetical protein
MKVVKFHPEHLLEMQNRDFEPLMRSMEEAASQYIEIGPAVTITTDDGEIVVCGGVAVYSPGVGEAWMFSSDAILRYPLGTTKLARGVIEDAERTCNLHRVQALCVATVPMAERWLKALGFKYEGLMEKYGVNKEDYLRYVRIEKCQQI